MAICITFIYYLKILCICTHSAHISLSATYRWMHSTFIILYPAATENKVSN